MMKTVLELCFYLCFFVLLFPRWSPLRDYSQIDVLSRANRLRGIFAVEIVIGHAVQNTETQFLIPFDKLMICSVAFFFFVSAAGMTLSAKKKKDYFQVRFLLEKPAFIFLVSIIVYIFNIIMDLLIPAASGVHSSLFLADYFLRTNWFLWELILFYLVFYVVYRYLPVHRLMICTAFIVAVSAVFYFIGMEESWYASAVGFPMGLWFAEYAPCGVSRDLLTGGTVKRFLLPLVFVIPLTVFGLLSLVIVQQTFTTMFLMRNSICAAMLLLLILVLNAFSLGENAVALFLGEYSAEIFFFQFPWLRITLILNCHYLLRVLLVITATLVTAVLFHPLLRLMKKSCSRAFAPENSRISTTR